MVNERLSHSDLRIFEVVLAGELASGRIAKAIGLSPSYTSECLRRLLSMGLILTRRKGITVFARPSTSQVAAALALLMKEGSGLDVSKVLTGPGLALLPHILPPGKTARDLVAAARLSQMTVMERIRLWREMGLVVREKGTGLYKLAPGQRELADFAQRYAEDRDRRMLAGKIPGALILWRGSDGFLFSVDAGTAVKGFVPAGPSALEEPIVRSRDYYIGGQQHHRLSRDEALVQTLLVDPSNPRVRRMLRKRADSSAAARHRLAAFAEKYGIAKELAGAPEG
jgi:DNA-binding transcriptional ArsR family regulator